jgi:hypothetical protein
MKYCCGLLLFIGFAVAAQGQPVLTATDVTPQVGESFGLRNFDASTVSPGPGGAAQIWDFSGVTPEGGGATTVIDPSAAPNAADYPQVNRVLQQDTNYFYYEATASVFQLYGFLVAGSQAIYTDPDEHLTFPITFGDKNTDRFEGTLDVDIDGFGTVRSHRYGTTTIEADGYGTLILPNGTYTNVLRVHLLSEQTDSIRFLFFDSIIHTTIEMHQWWVAGEHVPVMSITETVTDFQPDPIFLGAYMDATLGLPGLAENQSVTLFPTITDGTVQLRYRLTGAETVDLKLFDVSGQEIRPVLQGTFAGGNHTETINLSDLVPGIYFFGGTIGDEVVHERLVVR